MRTRRFIHPAALALAAGLLLTSCSSGSDSEDDTIEGAQNGQEQHDNSNHSPSPNSTATDDGIDRPKIELPDTMNNVFEDTETGNSKHDAIIADVTRWIEAQDMGFATGNPEHEAIDFYATGEGLISSRQFVRSSVEAGLSWAGTVVYYDFEVEDAPNSDRATVGFCEDITELRDVDLETGATQPPSVEDPQFFLYTKVALRQNDLGVWQVERVLPEDESDQLDKDCER